MNKKGILIIALMIGIIFSLQAVAASDVEINNATLATHDSDIVVFSNDVSAYSLPNSNNLLAAGDAGTFSELQTDLPSSGSIDLERNYTFDSSTDSGLVQGIPINNDVIINGGGKVVIDAKNQARVFDIQNGATVKLIGITFINGNALAGNGGSINSAGTLHIENCKFINNTA